MRALVGVAIGALDIAVTRRAWRRKLRMSKAEVRRRNSSTVINALPVLCSDWLVRLRSC